MDDEVYLKIYKDKNGEIDFGISNIDAFEYEKMKEIRSMVITAIYIMEDEWRRKREKLYPAAQVSKGSPNA